MRQGLEIDAGVNDDDADDDLDPVVITRTGGDADGDDDGGPQRDSEECDTGNDDIGLRMTAAAVAAP